MRLALALALVAAYFALFRESPYVTQLVPRPTPFGLSMGTLLAVGAALAFAGIPLLLPGRAALVGFLFFACVGVTFGMFAPSKIDWSYLLYKSDLADGRAPTWRHVALALAPLALIALYQALASPARIGHDLAARGAPAEDARAARRVARAASLVALAVAVALAAGLAAIVVAPAPRVSVPGAPVVAFGVGAVLAVAAAVLALARRSATGRGS